MRKSDLIALLLSLIVISVLASLKTEAACQSGCGAPDPNNGCKECIRYDDGNPPACECSGCGYMDCPGGGGGGGTPQGTVAGRVIPSADGSKRFQKTGQNCPAVQGLTYLNANNMKVSSGSKDADWGCNNEPYYEIKTNTGANTFTLTPPEGYECDWWDSVIWVNEQATEVVSGTGCDAAIDVRSDYTRHTWYRVKPPCSDNDGDGDKDASCGGNDCNDNNPNLKSTSSNPYCNCNDADGKKTGSEICDGLDNDCDGVSDNGFDQDEDGFTSCNGDCNDNPNTGGKSIYPGAPEKCDGIDHDCDGQPYLGADPELCKGACEQNTQKGYGAEGFYQYLGTDGNQYLAQNIISASGQISWGRSCPIDNSKELGVDWERCSEWNSVTLTSGPDNPSSSAYGAYCEYDFLGNDGKKLVQTMISKDGRRSWNRKCPVGAVTAVPITFTWSAPESGETPTSYTIRADKEQDVWTPEVCNNPTQLCTGEGGSGDFVSNTTSTNQQAAIETDETYDWSLQALPANENSRKTSGGSFSCSANGAKTQISNPSSGTSDSPTNLQVNCMPNNNEIVYARFSWNAPNSGATKYTLSVNKHQNIWSPAPCNTENTLCGNQLSGDFVITTTKTTFKAYIAPGSTYGFSVQANPSQNNRRTSGGSFSCSNTGQKTQISGAETGMIDSPGNVNVNCEYFPNNGINWQGCTEWQYYDLATDNLDAVPVFSGCDEYASGNQYVVRSLIHSEGQYARTQKCSIDTTKQFGVEWKSCTPILTLDLTSDSPDSNNPRYRSLSSYKFTASDGTPYIVHKIRHADGIRSWYRKCEIDESSGDGINRNECSEWIEPEENSHPTNSQIIIRAKGQNGDGWPIMQLWQKEQEWIKINEWTVDTTTYRTYITEISSLNPGQQMAVVFTNDLDPAGPPDRNIIVDYVIFDDKLIQAEDKTKTTYDRGIGAEAFDGQDIISSARRETDSGELLSFSGALIFDTTGSNWTWITGANRCCGNQQDENIKSDPTTCSIGCCKQTECYDSQSGCISTGTVSGSRFCENGKWVNRKSIGFLTLSEYAKNNQLTNPSIFCGGYTDVLNKYNYLILQNLAEAYFNEGCFRQDRLCGSDLCVLSSDEKIILSGSLNQKPTQTQLKALVNYDSSCPAIDAAANIIKPCSQNPDKLWYDQKTNVFIYSSEAITLDENKWNVNIQRLGSDEQINSISGIYTSLKDPFNEIAGNVTSKCGQNDKMSISYAMNTNICSATTGIDGGNCIENNDLPGISKYRIEAEKTGENNRYFLLWKELTSKLGFK